MEAVAGTGRLLQPLTRTEADELWQQLIKALRLTSGEIAMLERCPKATRDMLYGPGVLEQYQGMRDDLVDLLDNSI